jgi:hypothetical protein
MNLHRYKIKFGSGERYDSDISTLGTLIGFFGLFYTIIIASLLSNRDPEISSAIIIVFVSYAFYIAATYHKYLLFLFFVISVLAAIYSGMTGFEKSISCELMDVERWKDRCLESAIRMKVTSGYFTSLSIISGVLSFIKSRKSLKLNA